MCVCAYTCFRLWLVAQVQAPVGPCVHSWGLHWLSVRGTLETGKKKKVEGKSGNPKSFPVRVSTQSTSGTIKSPQSSRLGPTNPCTVLSYTSELLSTKAGSISAVRPYRHCSAKDSLPLIPQPLRHLGPLGALGTSGSVWVPSFQHGRGEPRMAEDTEGGR